MDDTKSRAIRSRLTTILRALPCTRARVTRDRVTSPHPHPHPARHTGNSKLEKILVVLLLRWPCICLRCLLKIHAEPDLITSLHGFNGFRLSAKRAKWLPAGGRRARRLALGPWTGVGTHLPRSPMAGVSREPARSRRAGPGRPRTRAPPTVRGDGRAGARARAPAKPKTTAAVINVKSMAIIAG
jgi:hypothetical protein